MLLKYIEMQVRFLNICYTSNNVSTDEAVLTSKGEVKSNEWEKKSALSTLVIEFDADIDDDTAA